MTWADVASHSAAFLVGALTGAAGQYLADKYTDQRRKQETESEREAQFEDVQRAMPALITKIKADLVADEFVREFVVLPTKTIIYNSGHKMFSYHLDEYEELRGWLAILEDAGYIRDVSTRRETPIFRMTQDFVRADRCSCRN